MPHRPSQAPNLTAPFTRAMTRSMTRRQALTALGALLLARPSVAAPMRYRLDNAASRVGFTFRLNGQAQTGTMPVRRAAIMVDPDNLRASRVDVSLDVSRARTGLIFATRALTGPQVLDAARYPEIRFVSTRVQLGPGGRLSDGARLSGWLTIRDQTRPVTLAADLFRQPGSAPDDLDQLTVRLRGTINRSAFGASGHANIVADPVDLNVVATIRRAN